MGCGYHSAGYDNKLSAYKTISVPYVQGDSEGNLTSVLTKTLVDSGILEYKAFDSDVSLIVQIQGSKVEDVGYNRQYNAEGQIETWMNPNERRLSVLVNVSVIDEATQKTILGPVPLSMSVKYDFDQQFSEDNLVQFSLAQYNFFENSERIAYESLNQRLSRLIVDYLVNAW